MRCQQGWWQLYQVYMGIALVVSGDNVKDFDKEIEKVCNIIAMENIANYMTIKRAIF